MMMFKYLCPALLLLCLLPGEAEAQFQRNESHGKWEVSFFGGAAFPDEDIFPTPVQGQEAPNLVEMGYSSGYLVGVSVTENLGQHIGAELSYSFANQPLRFRNLRLLSPVVEREQKTHDLLYSLLYYPLDRSSKIRPFVSIGAGAAFYQVQNADLGDPGDDIELVDRWKFAGSLGGGVKILLNNQWGVRFDVKDMITGVPDYGLPATAPLVLGVPEAGLRTDGIFHNWRISAGVLYYWGDR